MSIKPEPHSPQLLDCSESGRALWIVKVPKYLSTRWKESPGGAQLGNLAVRGKFETGGSDVVFTSTLGTAPVDLKDDKSIVLSSAAFSPATIRGKNSMAIFKPKPASGQSSANHPSNYQFSTKDLDGQTLVVLGEETDGSSVSDTPSPVKRTRKVALGRVKQRAELRPQVSDQYMSMKKTHFESCSQPNRVLKQIEKAAVKYKPVAAHADLLEKERSKKEASKNPTVDKDALKQMLFGAFAKHQYYRLADLHSITKQSPNFIKEVLTEIARYNTQPPYKSMWELKPEYRHYDLSQQEEGNEK